MKRFKGALLLAILLSAVIAYMALATTIESQRDSVPAPVEIVCQYAVDYGNENLGRVYWIDVAKTKINKQGIERVVCKLGYADSTR
jgi:hypothetical protein